MFPPFESPWVVDFSRVQTKRTLRMLHNENIKSGKELQRKIAKLEEEGKDPNMPIPSTSYRTRRTNSQVSDLGRSEITSSSTLRQRESMSSTVDESFMLLAQQVRMNNA